ncbi:MAG: hypothetical protein RQ801_10060 [Spirochaetaceae bacterium]|nr:hypothetical protein [Spirochaetaceae bacterium]MDT8298633.1 hypothetical protein [Spirochaetaceae bacterium]
MKQIHKKSTPIPVEVPGCIHTDLLAEGLIDDPFYRAQEFDAAWVAETDWEYSRDFVVDASLLSHDRVELVCGGLDTLAAIRINDKLIEHTDNMFRRYQFDVRQVLKPGENRIRILFESAVNYTEAQNKIRNLPTWNLQVLTGYPGHLRKEQCSFGWVWGIRTPTCGSWRDIGLAAFSGARLQDVRISQEHIGGRVELTIQIETEVFGGTAPKAAGNKILLYTDPHRCYRSNVIF